MNRYFAACTLGLEATLAGELRALGAHEVAPGRGGCAFAGPPALGYAACLWLRSAVRVQQELARGAVAGRDDLYRLAQSVDWTASIDHRQTLAVDAAVRDSFANDSRFPALVVKDAVCDQLRSRQGRRPDVARDDPDLPVKLVLRGREALLYRDLSGAPLHKRGYGAIQHKSPLNEALAAGLLLLTGWDGQGALCDPMCGAATLLVEAALLALDRAPGLARSFAFERWRDLDASAWEALYDGAEARAAAGARRTLPPLLGNDRHPGALALARQAIEGAGLAGRIALSQGDARDWTPPVPPRLVVVNPPYGARLEADPEELAASWRALGAFLHRCQGATAFVLSGNPELTRHLGLRARRRHPVHNGPIECRWLCYEIGSAAAR